MGRKKRTKTKPASIRSFFPTLKNSQGFGLHLCRYEEKVGDHVYQPKNYGQVSRQLKAELCIWCKLKPCITIEHHECIQDVLFDKHQAHDKEKEAGKKVRSAPPVNRAERFMVKLMTRYFGKEYMKKEGVPNCCMREAWRFHTEWKEIIEREAEETRAAAEDWDANNSDGEEEGNNTCNEEECDENEFSQ